METRRICTRSQAAKENGGNILGKHQRGLHHGDDVDNNNCTVNGRRLRGDRGGTAHATGGKRFGEGGSKVSP